VGVTLCGLALGGALAGLLVSRTVAPVAARPAGGGSERTAAPSPEVQLPGGIGGPDAVPGVDLLQDAANAIGISEQSLEIGLQTGQTIALVAVVNGDSVQDVITALVNTEITAIQDRVASGTITTSQAGQMESQLTQTVTAFVYQVPVGSPLQDAGGSWEQAALEDAAGAIGISATTLEAGLAAGQSIADVASAHDASVASVVGAVMALVDNQIAGLESSDELTVSEAAGLTGELRSAVEEWVDGTSPGLLFGPLGSSVGDSVSASATGQGSGPSPGPSPPAPTG
jgi:hypothetical protein